MKVTTRTEISVELDRDEVLEAMLQYTPITRHALQSQNRQIPKEEATRSHPNVGNSDALSILQHTPRGRHPSSLSL